MLTLNDIYHSFRLPLTPRRKDLIAKAYSFAENAHRGQKRRSGEDYFQHSIATAKILAEIGMGSKTVAAGLLHDVPEDTSVTLIELEENFGKEIAQIVEGITKLGKIKLRGNKEEYFLENLRKMFLAMAADIRVVIIKLADRLHNMRTLQYNPPEKQQRIAKETMEIYVPLANRLGIGEIKGELADLSFQYLDPQNYQKTENLRNQYYKQAETYLKKGIKELKKELKKHGINTIEIYGRTKRTYSLFLKLQRHDMNINRIFDLVAIRIIVPEVVDCYETLGIVHEKYRPMIGRIKDYISLPKPNGYQSIHTTIFGPEGKILEVQIRTPKMHQEAEFGIAAHWIYSEKEQSLWKNVFNRKHKGKVPEKEIQWVKQLRDWQKEIGRDDKEFIEGLKIDFFKNRIFALTPLGDIIDLPEDATPIDFAYAIHTEIGHRTTGAKVNGKMVPLDYKIKNGEIVEILTTKKKKLPNRNWLYFIKTSAARSHIRRALRESQENI